LHIALHGCEQNINTVGMTFVEGSGFARWADTNRLVILFPQVSASVLNPKGCWDWWGYTGNDYLTRGCATDCGDLENGRRARKESGAVLRL